MYELFPRIFRDFRLFEVVILMVNSDAESGKADTGLTIAMCEEGYGLFVDSVEEDSPNKSTLFPGDVILEIQSHPITSVNVFSMYFTHGCELFVQRGC